MSGDGLHDWQPAGIVNTWRTIETIDVIGDPIPAGSKAYKGHAGGKPIIVDSSGAKGKNWRNAIFAQCRHQYTGHALRGPLSVWFTFRLVRPTADHVANDRTRPVKESAPCYHVKRPDALKLARAAEDSGTGVLWHDDSQIVREFLIKEYADHAEPGVKITLQRPARIRNVDATPAGTIRAALEFYAAPANHLDADGPNHESRAHMDCGELARIALRALDSLAGTL